MKLKWFGSMEEGLTLRGHRNLRIPLRFGLRPQGPCRVGTGESGLVLSEEGKPAVLSSRDAGLLEPPERPQGSSGPIPSWQ